MGRHRLIQLDMLRGFAIFLVMGVHVPAYPIWSTMGGLGVDLFFVLSGFLIANLLFTEYRATAHIRFGRFLLRRALKLYPSFYLLLALTLLYCTIWHVPVNVRQILGEATMTQNYLAAIWGHTWSLAVEEHFYLALPLLLAFLMKRGRGSADPFRAIPYVFLGVALVCLALRVIAITPDALYSHRDHYEPSHLRADSLFFGVFLAYLHNFRPHILQKLMSDPWRLPVSMAGVIALAPACFLPSTDPIIYTVGFTGVYLGFGTMLLLSIYQEGRQRAKPGLGSRAIARMGVYSYTLYLWHVPLAQVFGALARHVGGINQYLLHAIYFATTIVVGVVTAKLVEIPALKLRERLLPASTLTSGLQNLARATQRDEVVVATPASDVVA